MSRKQTKKREKHEAVSNLYKLRKDLSENDKPIKMEKFIEKLQYPVVKSTLYSYEKGKTDASLDVLIDISRTYNVPLDYLVGFTDVSSTDGDLMTSHYYTGLSEHSLKMLNHYNQYDPDKIALINLLLEQDSLEYRFADYYADSEYEKFKYRGRKNHKYPELLDDLKYMLLAQQQSDYDLLFDVVDSADFIFDGIDNPLSLKQLKELNVHGRKAYGNKLANLVEQMYANRFMSKLKSLGKVYCEMIAKSEE
jgi:transcriptional regulator with XRE-family HTH domain